MRPKAKVSCDRDEEFSTSFPGTTPSSVCLGIVAVDFAPRISFVPQAMCNAGRVEGNCGGISRTLLWKRFQA